MSKDSESKELKPPLKTLQWYVKICKEINKNPLASNQDIADALNCPVETVKKTIKEANNAYRGITLLKTVQKKKGTTLTTMGRQLWREAEAMLSLYESFLEKTSESVIRIGTSNALLVLMLPFALKKYVRRTRGRSELAFLEGDYNQLVKAVSDEEVDIAFGPHISQSPFVNVDIESLAELDVVALCPNRHPWNERENPIVGVEDFAEERVLVLESSEQPDVFDGIRIDPERGGERITMQNYTSIFAAVSMGIGVSVIPALPKFKASTGSKMLSTNGFARAKISAYMPKGGRNALTNEATDLLNCVEEWLGR